MSFALAPPAAPTYTPSPAHYQPQHPVQPHRLHLYYQLRDPTIHTPGFESSLAGTAGLGPTRPSNVQVNPLPDHGLSSSPTINMISVCTVGEDESKQEGPIPFVIEYVSAEATVGFTGFCATGTLFVIEVPSWEPYRDSKVLWTYEGNVRKPRAAIQHHGLNALRPSVREPEGHEQREGSYCRTRSLVGSHTYPIEKGDRGGS
ncbi:hypothetical protein CRG98_009952 [Punica granatum]|uniref:Uncharacterized protein n=1 Tax=Punica granatum TaxID=22663 RepID=A0A2I0KMG7_PUNGR|nr:hypothetical protein CRG98_009952 [Punica granatum]